MKKRANFLLLEGLISNNEYLFLTLPKKKIKKLIKELDNSIIYDDIHWKEPKDSVEYPYLNYISDSECMKIFINECNKIVDNKYNTIEEEIPFLYHWEYAL